jgi:hypothetical protein
MPTDTWRRLGIIRPCVVGDLDLSPPGFEEEGERLLGPAPRRSSLTRRPVGHARGRACRLAETWLEDARLPGDGDGTRRRSRVHAPSTRAIAESSSFLSATSTRARWCRQATFSGLESSIAKLHGPTVVCSRQ